MRRTIISRVLPIRRPRRAPEGVSTWFDPLPTPGLVVARRISLEAGSDKGYRVPAICPTPPTGNLCLAERAATRNLLIEMREGCSSGNKFRRLRWAIRIIGRVFGPKTIPGMFDLPPADKRIATRRPTVRKPERTRTTASDYLWDSILLVLQPPLGLATSQVMAFPHALRPYQLEGVKFLADTHPGALLADDMGLGKTVQAVVALRFLFQSGRIRRALIVAPLGAVRQWEDHLREWAPLLRQAVCRGSFDVRKEWWKLPAHVYLATYGVVRQDITYLSALAERGPEGNFDVVVLDECSKIKNAGSKQSQAVKKVHKKTGWALSGTPIENDLDDLYSVFDFLHPQLLSRPEILSPSDVRQRIGPFTLRRRKADVAKDLPAKVVTEVWDVDLTDAQRRAYDQAYETGVVELRAEEERQTLTVTHVLALITKLRQICNFDPKTGASSKAEWLSEKLSELSSEEKMLVFSQFKDDKFGVGAIRARLVGCLPENAVQVYTGSMSESQRRATVDCFRQDPDKRVLLLTYGAGSHGLNLQAASYVVLFDHWWNPAVNSQAEDRAHRIGQTQTVFSYHLWVPGTIEERVWGILHRKRDLFNRVIDSLAVEGVASTGLTEEELFGLFDLKPPRSKQGQERYTVVSLLAVTPVEFERIVGRAWEKQGFEVRYTAASGDAGIDAIAVKNDPLNPQRIAIQCKQHRNPVGRTEAQKLVGAVSTDPRYTEAILVAASGFTDECIAYARSQGILKLIDGDRLCRLLNEG